MIQDDLNRLDGIFIERAARPPKTLSETMDSLKNRAILLYGAGVFGGESLEMFRHFGIEPVAFLDQAAASGDTKMGIPVYPPHENALPKKLRENCLVYISIVLPGRELRSIAEQLYEYGYRSVRSMQLLRGMRVPFESIESENPSDEWLLQRREQIAHGLLLMADEESRETYLSCIRAHLLREYDNCIETAFPVQYFDAGVPLRKKMSCLVDCGAYIGDSLVSALQCYNQIESYIGFEPIPESFRKLSKTVSQYNNRVRNAYLYPCGVAGQTEMAKFSVYASASAVTEDEGEMLPVIRLDDVLKNVPVSFLKMDIEGMEPMALRGAEQLIRQHSPDLAICVYHAVNHYWEIPALIQKINPRYRFYLRTHTPATMESVLYCTC